MQSSILSQSIASVFAIATCSLLFIARTINESHLQARDPITFPSISMKSPATNGPQLVTLERSPEPIANFLLAGAQKAGTTALAAYLFRRHDTCGPIPRSGLSYTGKEAHFFDEEAMMRKGLDHYQSLFQRCDRNNTRVIMDATPKYMLHPENVRKIYEEHGTADTVKIMFILREPVSREISWYKHLVHAATSRRPPTWSRRIIWNATSDSVMSFEDFVDTVVAPSFQSKSEGARGLYAHWLRNWFQLFDRQQILIMSYDDFRRNETDFLQRMHDFLDLPDPVSKDNRTPKANRHSDTGVVVPCRVQRRLASLFESHNHELYQLLQDHRGPAPEATFPKFQFQCNDE